MSGPTLGQLITSPQQRDAIHIAVAPVVAATYLYPAQHVGFVGNDREEVGPCETPVGIVDPYLTNPVIPGQQFWLLLYPNTITALRHDWTHPAFDPVPEIAESRSWIELFAAEIGQTYESLMNAATEWVKEGNYTKDNSQEYLRAGNEQWSIFWKHYEIVTGTKVEYPEPGFFFCSC